MKNILLISFILSASFCSLQAQDIKQQLSVALKEDANLKIIVNGKPFDFPLELINPDYIASIKIVKGEKALEEYQSAEGMISIITKGIPKPVLSDKKDNKHMPLFIIDGKIAAESILEEISPEDIDHIEVIKGERAIEEYDTPNGVILITTKKGKKRKKKN